MVVWTTVVHGTMITPPSLIPPLFLFACAPPLPPLVVACGRGKRWKPAVDLLETMRRQGLTPDAVSYDNGLGLLGQGLLVGWVGGGLFRRDRSFIPA